MRKTAARINNYCAWLMFAGANVALVLISLSVFGAGSSEIHAWGGRIVWLISLVALLAALAARASRLNIGVTLLTALLIFPGQGFFAYAEFSEPSLHALHAANGLAIMYLSYALASGRARAVVEAEHAVLAPAD